MKSVARRRNQEQLTRPQMQPPNKWLLHSAEPVAAAGAPGAAWQPNRTPQTALAAPRSRPQDGASAARTRKLGLDLSAYDGLVLRVKSDGQTFQLDARVVRPRRMNRGVRADGVGAAVGDTAEVSSGVADAVLKPDSSNILARVLCWLSCPRAGRRPWHLARRFS